VPPHLRQQDREIVTDARRLNDARGRSRRSHSSNCSARRAG
jgi:hypothetical protein